MTYRYFQKYPLTVFSLDEYKTGQVLPNLTVRSKFLSNVVTNASLYDEYDIVDGETPETTASKFYGDAGLHWIILQSNDILDPRFGWPLSPFDLKKFAEGKYNNINGVHHYENDSGDIVTANVKLRVQPHNRTDSNVSSRRPEDVVVGDVFVNNTGLGVAVVTNRESNKNFDVLVSKGGFVKDDVFFLASNINYVCNVISVQEINDGSTPVTNILYEDSENEKKRRIKILNVDLIPDIISEFETLMKK